MPPKAKPAAPAAAPAPAKKTDKKKTVAVPTDDDDSTPKSNDYVAHHIIPVKTVAEKRADLQAQVEKELGFKERKSGSSAISHWKIMIEEHHIERAREMASRRIHAPPNEFFGRNPAEVRSQLRKAALKAAKEKAKLLPVPGPSTVTKRTNKDAHRKPGSLKAGIPSGASGKPTPTELVPAPKPGEKPFTGTPKPPKTRTAVNKPTGITAAKTVAPVEVVKKAPVNAMPSGTAKPPVKQQQPIVNPPKGSGTAAPATAKQVAQPIKSSPTKPDQKGPAKPDSTKPSTPAPTKQSPEHTKPGTPPTKQGPVLTEKSNDSGKDAATTEPVKNRPPGTGIEKQAKVKQVPAASEKHAQPPTHGAGVPTQGTATRDVSKQAAPASKQAAPATPVPTTQATATHESSKKAPPAPVKPAPPKSEPPAQVTAAHEASKPVSPTPAKQASPTTESPTQITATHEASKPTSPAPVKQAPPTSGPPAKLTAAHEVSKQPPPVSIKSPTAAAEPAKQPPPKSESEKQTQHAHEPTKQPTTTKEVSKQAPSTPEQTKQASQEPVKQAQTTTMTKLTPQKAEPAPLTQSVVKQEESTNQAGSKAEKQQDPKTPESKQLPAVSPEVVAAPTSASVVKTTAPAKTFVGPPATGEEDPLAFLDFVSGTAKDGNEHGVGVSVKSSLVSPKTNDSDHHKTVVTKPNQKNEGTGQVVSPSKPIAIATTPESPNGSSAKSPGKKSTTPQQMAKSPKATAVTSPVSSVTPVDTAVKPHDAAPSKLDVMKAIAQDIQKKDADTVKTEPAPIFVAKQPSKSIETQKEKTPDKAAPVSSARTSNPLSFLRISADGFLGSPPPPKEKKEAVAKEQPESAPVSETTKSPEGTSPVSPRVKKGVAKPVKKPGVPSPVGSVTQPIGVVTDLPAGQGPKSPGKDAKPAPPPKPVKSGESPVGSPATPTPKSPGSKPPSSPLSPGGKTSAAKTTKPMSPPITPVDPNQPGAPTPKPKPAKPAKSPVSPKPKK